jgi:hypothetical protein
MSAARRELKQSLAAVSRFSSKALSTFDIRGIPHYIRKCSQSGAFSSLVMLAFAFLIHAYDPELISIENRIEKNN